MNISKTDLLIWLAGNFVGTQEVGGANKGALVERFQKAVDGKAGGESWCCAFIQFMIREVDGLGLLSGDMDGCPLAKTEWVQGLWDSAPKAAKSRDPFRGALMVWRAYDGPGADALPTEKGHVGLVTNVGPRGAIETIEGNTSSGTGDQRDGDGVYRRTRSLQGEGNLRVVGFLRVWG